VKNLSNALLQACKDLIDDSKTRCVDMVFKEVSLEILARAKHILNEKQFRELSEYAAERMEEKASISINSMQ
jgi:hypothetical protein